MEGGWIILLISATIGLILFGLRICLKRMFIQKRCRRFIEWSTIQCLSPILATITIFGTYLLINGHDKDPVEVQNGKIEFWFLVLLSFNYYALCTFLPAIRGELAVCCDAIAALLILIFSWFTNKTMDFCSASIVLYIILQRMAIARPRDNADEAIANENGQNLTCLQRLIRWCLNLAKYEEHENELERRIHRSNSDDSEVGQGTSSSSSQTGSRSWSFSTALELPRYRPQQQYRAIQIEDYYNY